MDATTSNSEFGLIEASRIPGGWLWAFTCPTPDCGCRTALLLSAPQGRDTLLECGRVVADAWHSRADYPARAQELKGVTAFAIDLDTREIFAPVPQRPIDPRVDPAVKAVVDGLDDVALDAIARVWHLGKGEQAPVAPGDGAGAIEIEGWRPGDPVVWDHTQPALRADTYVLREHVYDAIELYCVEPDCTCGIAIVDFVPVAPRGASHPGDIKFDGTSAALRPRGRHSRLPELWAAYQERHPHHQERFAQRCAIMHGLAGRIVAEPPKPKVKGGRNERCRCGSGKKFKVCCGAA